METVHTHPSRIMILTDDFGGGTGNHLLSMMRFWDKSIFGISIVSQAPLTARITPEVPVTYLPPLRRFEKYPLGQTNRLNLLRRFMSRNPPDIVHAYFFWSILYARLLKRLGIVKCLVENREDQGFNWGKHEYALLRLTKSLPDMVICVCEAVREVVLQKEGVNPERTAVIHNGIESSIASAADRGKVLQDLGLAEDHMIVGMVANLNRSIKGVNYFLDAVPVILEAVPSARFLIIGGGSDERFLVRYAMELGVEPYVIFAGYQEDVARYYSIMDISVLTSLSEGLSITLLESMSHGLPVVATDVGGNPEVVVHGKTGFLVPPKDVQAFANRVVELLRDGELRGQMGKEGLRRIQNRFQIEQAAKSYMKVYMRLLESNPLELAASTM